MEKHTPQLVTLRVLAQRLRLPARWLKDEADAGRIPHLKAGQRILFSLTAVEQTLIQRAAGGEQ